MTPESIWKTRLAPPPLIVTPAVGPVIVGEPELNASWPAVRVIVWAVLNTVELNVIDCSVACGTFAKLTAWPTLRSPKGDPVPSETVLTTSGLVWKAPMSGLGVSSGMPRWSIVIGGVPAFNWGVTPVPSAALADTRGMVSVGPP